MVVDGDPKFWAKASDGGLNVTAVGTGDPMLHLVVGAGLPADSLMAKLGRLGGH